MMRRWNERKPLTMGQKDSILGFVLILPVVLLIALVILYPILYNIRLSFFDVALNPKKPDVFVGLDNYMRLLTDKEFYKVLITTVLFVAVSVTLSTGIGLGVAILFNRQFPGRGIARSLILLSYVTPMISLVYVWKYMFNAMYGVVNYILIDVLHLLETAPAWFDNIWFAFASVVVFDTWRLFPYAFMMILAALQAVDTSMYEAAEIDGAGAWGKFRYITLPEILPVVSSVATLRMIWNFYKFDDIYLLTQQLPVIGIYLYKTSFAANDFGSAAAITVVLFVIVMTLVFLMRKVVFRRNAA
ncbi:sugar ABC transporter permease [Clostridium sp. MCC353]|uniref:carbohydrate ABC transporter permease n=1 Tax=Clostridium sp. MCC353 TaxID=2592646 RepID=UPI001C01A35A|nr:sugar ABC transporter permease [Clostridium sp. MCC353]